MLIPRRASRRATEAQLRAERDDLGDRFVDSQVALEVEKQARHVAELRAQRLQADLHAVTSAKRNWAEDIASLRRELEAAEAAAVTAHKRADAWENDYNKAQVEHAAQFHAILKGETLHPIVKRLIRTLWVSRRRLQTQLSVYFASEWVDAVELAAARREIEELRAKLEKIATIATLAGGYTNDGRYVELEAALVEITEMAK